MEPKKHLTQEEKDNLLEMCRDLYPEYKDIHISNFDGEFGDAEGGDSVMFEPRIGDIRKWDNHWNIHWFELCWKILNKLIGGYTPLKMQEEIKNFGIVCFNNSIVAKPIDYLYELYLKNKLNR